MIEDCPSCGSKLEKGFIHAGGKVTWSKKRHIFFLRGETVVPLFAFDTNYEAYRCRNCKLVLFYYWKNDEM